MKVISLFISFQRTYSACTSSVFSSNLAYSQYLS